MQTTRPLVVVQELLMAVIGAGRAAVTVAAFGSEGPWLLSVTV
ncbi:hypothetical protein STENM223S_01859 [Streptomyces tendae]